LGGPEEHSLAELAQLVNGRQVPLRCVSAEQFSAQRGVSATMVDLMTRGCAPRAVEATAARFGVQLTPLSLAWPLDDPDSFDEDPAMTPTTIFSFAQNL
jgi:NADH dehydrogenase